jgi:hypothetical protein
MLHTPSPGNAFCVRILEWTNDALRAMYAVSKGIDKVYKAIVEFGKKFFWVHNVTCATKLSAQQQGLLFYADVTIFGKRKQYKYEVGNAFKEGNKAQLAEQVKDDAKQLANNEPAALQPPPGGAPAGTLNTASDSTITEVIRKSVGIFGDAASTLCSISAVSINGGAGLAAIAALEYPDDQQGDVAVEGCQFTASADTGLDSSGIPAATDKDVNVSADRRLILRFCDTAAVNGTNVTIPSDDHKAALQSYVATLGQLAKTQAIYGPMRPTLGHISCALFTGVTTLISLMP